MSGSPPSVPPTSWALVLDRLRRRFRGAPIEPADVDAAWVDDVASGGRLPPVDLRGLSDFDRRAYDVVRTTSAGETITYGEVAARIGAPRAARAVGGAMARCPLFPAVPCHRVVRASDGWSGWSGDTGVKRALLRLEAAAAG